MSDELPEEPEITPELTEAELKERVKAHNARDNEDIKFLAAASDRLSTAAFAVGIFGPVATIMANPAAIEQLDAARLSALSVAMTVWFVVGSILHTWGRRTLMKGWKI